MKDKFNNQFATQRLRTEMSNTSGPGSATVSPAENPKTGEQAFPRATKKVVRKKLKKEERDVEPKLAAGKAPKIPGDWTDAPSIPNRPSKGGFIYKQLFESEESVTTLQNILDKKGSLDHLKGMYLKIIDGPFTQKNPDYKDKGCRFLFYDAREKLVGVELEDKKSTNLYPKELVVDTARFNANEEKLNENADPFVGREITLGKITYKVEKRLENGDYKLKSTEEGYPGTTATKDTLKRAEKLNENYSRFKKETRTRTNEQQLHTAMRLAEKKIREANRILEYTSKLRTELTETRMNKNTQKLMERITRGIAEAYGKMKKLK